MSYQFRPNQTLKVESLSETKEQPTATFSLETQCSSPEELLSFTADYFEQNRSLIIAHDGVVYQSTPPSNNVVLLLSKSFSDQSSYIWELHKTAKDSGGRYCLSGYYKLSVNPEKVEGWSISLKGRHELLRNEKLSQTELYRVCIEISNHIQFSEIKVQTTPDTLRKLSAAAVAATLTEE